jgi:hypothetical protein
LLRKEHFIMRMQQKFRRLVMEQLEPRLALSSYFVSPTGNDTNAGTNAAPFATLRQAALVVVAGDTVTVRAGTYNGFSLNFAVAQTGTPGNPITFQADPGVTITNHNHETADGIDYRRQ